MIDNIYVKTDSAGNVKLDKEKSTEKIYGAIAMIMVLDRSIRNKENISSIYDKREIWVL